MCQGLFSLPAKIVNYAPPHSNSVVFSASTRYSAYDAIKALASFL